MIAGVKPWLNHEKWEKKVRCTFLLPEKIVEELDFHCRKERSTPSQIVTEALKLYFGFRLRGDATVAPEARVAEALIMRCEERAVALKEKVDLIERLKDPSVSLTEIRNDARRVKKEIRELVNCFYKAVRMVKRLEGTEHFAPLVERLNNASKLIYEAIIAASKLENLV